MARLSITSSLRATFAHDLIGIERGLARRPELNDGILGRRMNGLRRLPSTLRHPLAHVVAARVVPLTLSLRIENAEVRRGIRTGAGDPLPVHRVGGEVGIHQRVPEPAGAVLPAL